MSWSFAHKDGLGVISHTGPNGYSFIEVSDVYSSRFMAKRTPNEACIGMSNMARRVANESLCMPREGTEITVDEARRRMREAETVAVTAVEETQGLTDQSCGVFAAMHSLSRPAEDPGGRMVRVDHGDLIGESADASMTDFVTVSVHLKTETVAAVTASFTQEIPVVETPVCHGAPMAWDCYDKEWRGTKCGCVQKGGV